MSPNRLQAKPPDVGTLLHATLKQPKNPTQEFPGNVCLEGWHKPPQIPWGFSFREQYPSHKQCHLFSTAEPSSSRWALINQIIQLATNSRRVKVYVTDAPKRTLNTDVASHSLSIGTGSKSHSLFISSFSAESHNYSNNSTCSALAICKWKAEMPFIRAG